MEKPSLARRLFLLVAPVLLCLVSISAATAGVPNTWSAAARMAAARVGHTATLLSDGKVLIAGGSYGAALDSAELYDPGTDTWSPAAGMASAREYHTATLLPNGKVLVAGGTGASVSNTAELYDPGTNTWTAAASMANARYNHTATVLPDGTVLVAGGWGAFGAPVSSAERYDPTTNTWTAAGTMATTRENHTATLLPDGRVLVAGGYTECCSTLITLNSAELYDPGTNTWSSAGSMAVSRADHTATLLANGKVLIAGGDGGGGAMSSADLYDPGTNTWSAAASMSTPRQLHTATLLSSGQVLVAGGTGAGDLSSTELYDPGTNTWSAAGSMATGRYDHTATLLGDGAVLVAGGWGAPGILDSAEVYTPFPCTAEDPNCDGDVDWSNSGAGRPCVQDHAGDSNGDGYSDADELTPPGAPTCTGAFPSAGGLGQSSVNGACPGRPLGSAAARTARADINVDGVVNGLDLGGLASHFAQTWKVPTDLVAEIDLNGDGAINGLDLGILASNFTRDVPPC